MHNILFIRLIGLELNLYPQLVQDTEKDLQFHGYGKVFLSFLSNGQDKDSKLPCQGQHSCDLKGNQSEDKVDTNDGK